MKSDSAITGLPYTLSALTGGVLINGVEQNRKAPTTFQIPDAETRENLRVGETVKIGVNSPEDVPIIESFGERFWVVVAAKIAGGYVVQVKNDLIYVDQHGVDFNDYLFVEPQHILVA